MSCAELGDLLHAYADGELDLAHHARAEQHVASCSECARSLEGVRAVRSSLAGLSFEPPAGLEAAVRASVRRAERRSPAAGRVLALAAALAAGLVLGLLLRAPSSEDPLARELVANHVRSLMAHHLADVESTDQHTVKPWFDGKLPFAPRVHDFATAGFPLVGGRLDYLDGRPVAALVYMRRKHVINLFVWPEAGGDEPARSFAREGYNGLRWREGGSAFAAVSDVSASDLAELARLAREP